MIKKEKKEKPVIIEQSSLAASVNDEEIVLDANEVYDEAEIASANEFGFTQKAIKNQLLKSKIVYPEEFDHIHCVDCEIKIPKQRLEIGAFRCVDCQNDFEKRARLSNR
jgi:RNA polymerase-binding transcription factor DksA